MSLGQQSFLPTREKGDSIFSEMEFQAFLVQIRVNHEKS